jgi:hypothetical protein
MEPLPEPVAAFHRVVAQGADLVNPSGAGDLIGLPCAPAFPSGPVGQVIGSPQPAMSNADAVTANRRTVFLIRAGLLPIQPCPRIGGGQEHHSGAGDGREGRSPLHYARPCAGP